MSAILDHFQVSKPGLKQQVAAGKPPVNTLFTYLDKAETVSFAPDQRFALRSQATLSFVFGPNWAPWSDPDDPGSQESHPCVIQYGSATEPASGFKLCVTRELDKLLLTSPQSHEPLIVQGKISDGATVVVCFGQKTSLHMKCGPKADSQDSYSFRPGKVNGAPTLTLGCLDEDPPCAGIIGNVLLFDQDLSQALYSEKGPAVDLFVALQRENLQGVFDIYSRGNADPDVLSLVGIGFPGEPTPRFDFIPREIMRPTGELPRWVLDNGDTKPIPVKLKGVADSNHAVHTTNNVFCFVRIPPMQVTPKVTSPGGVYLWGDQGQRFVLTYSGNNHFSGVADPFWYGGKWSGHKITLTYTPAPGDAHEPGRMKLECVGWDNNTEHIFATLICPAGAKLPAEIGDDVVWPASIAIKRLPADYRIAADIKTDMSEKWSSAFTKSLCNILANMQGWDISKLDNPISIGNSTAAIGTDDKDATLAPPPADSLNYRSENGSFLPYYCTTTNVDMDFRSKETTAYSSVTEVSQKVANSTELGLSVGEQKGAMNCSFSSVRNNSIDGSEDHAITISTSVTLSQAVALEKQWLKLNPEFLRALRNAEPKVAADLYPVFNKWGTHYPNAVIYGVGHYSIAFIDESGAGKLADAQNSSSHSLDIPITDSFLKLSTSTEKDDKSQTKLKAATEVETAIGIGTHEKLTVLRLDLRPISELIQPPYVSQDDLEWLFTAQPFVQAAMESYLASRPKLVPDGNLLYQAKLLKLENLSDKPCYFNARAFMVGVRPGEDDESYIYVPAEPADQENSQPIWCDSVRLEPRGDPDATHYPAQTFRNLTISRGDTSIVPQIRVTGVCNVLLPDGIDDVLTTYPEADSVWWMAGDGSAGGNPAPPPVHPSKSELKSKEESLGKVTIANVGIEWEPWQPGGPDVWFGENNASGKWTRTVVAHQVKQKLPLSNLQERGEIQESSFEVGDVRVTFQARKVDLLKCFQPAPANFEITPPEKATAATPKG
jgi:hypothetical protein